jgi:hypothetical protein
MRKARMSGLLCVFVSLLPQKSYQNGEYDRVRYFRTCRILDFE